MSPTRTSWPPRCRRSRRRSRRRWGAWPPSLAELTLASSSRAARMRGHGSRRGGGQGVRRRGVAPRRRRRRGGDRAPAALRRLVAAQGQARPRRELGGGRAARGPRGDRPLLPAGPRAAPRGLQGPRGARQGRALLDDGARGRRVHAQRGGRRGALAHPLRRGRAAHLSPRPRAGAGGPVNRERFPGLADGWARLDGPGGTQMVDAAIEAMDGWMRSGRTANEGGAFPHSHASEAVVEAARAAVARLLGGDPRGVVFGPSMTALTMAFSAPAGRALAPGDEIVCTRLDHDANVRPWLIAAQRAGASVRFADPEPDTLELPAAAVEAVLTERTRWVAVTAASNAVGTVPDLEGIVAAARAAGARVYVDAVHAAPHRPLDAAALGCDALACSAYKWFGPHVSILCAPPALLEQLEPDKLVPSPDEVPDRFELGTLPFEALAGVRAAADYVCSLDWDAVRAYEDGLLASALDGLGAMGHVRLHGAAPRRAPTLMFTVAGRSAREVAAAMAERQIAVWDGNYYAWELERHLGLAPHGAVRAGFVHYNDEADAERLLAAVADLA